MIDCLSEGRLIAGFVRGIPAEYLWYNIDPKESRGRFQEAYDLIMTAWQEPVWSYHGKFFQFYSTRQVPSTRPPNTSKQLHGHTHLSPTWVKEKPQTSPLLHYSWDRTWEALNALRRQDGSSFDSIALEYRHPQTGGPVMPTMACWVQLLQPGVQTMAHRHTGSAVYYVVQGEGATVIDGQRFIWGKGDIIALPPWALHEHANTSGSDDAVLFSIQDSPVLEALGLYHEEALSENGGHQDVTSTFTAASSVG